MKQTRFSAEHSPNCVTPLLLTVFSLNTKIIQYRKLPVFGVVNKMDLVPLKIQATKCSETSGTTCPAAHWHIPEDWNVRLPRCENFNTCYAVPYSLCFV